MKNMAKKKIICECVYFSVLVIISAIVVHNEYFSTAMIISTWFVAPMSIMYFIELCITRKQSMKAFVVIAVVNTLIVFGIMCILGAYVLNKYMNIVF